MFDIGFWELTLIGVIALLVVGPERLPAMARSVGLWVGRIRRYVSHVKDDIEREIRAEELREMMQESSRIESLDEELGEPRETLKAVEKEIEEADASLSRDDMKREEKPKSESDKAASDLGERIGGGSNTTAERRDSGEAADDDEGNKEERRTG